MRTAATVGSTFTGFGGFLLASTFIASGGLRQDRQLEDGAVDNRARDLLPPEPARQEHGLSATSVFSDGACW